MASAAIFYPRRKPYCKRIYRKSKTSPHGRAGIDRDRHQHNRMAWSIPVSFQFHYGNPHHHRPSNIANAIPISPGALGRRKEGSQILQRCCCALSLAARTEHPILYPRKRQPRGIPRPSLCLIPRVTDIALRLQILYMGTLVQIIRLISARKEVKTPNETPNRVSTKKPKSNIILPKVQLEP